MKAPAFWSVPDAHAARLLSPLGALVGRIALARMERPGVAAAVPVICVGNPTVGGAGKTPTARRVADRLVAAGHRVAILMRGYGGALKGPVRVDPLRHGAADVGDEALIHAAERPTYVARDRVAGAALAVGEGATLIVMDDGFQNPSLVKDAGLLVVDGAAGLGNGLLLPAGPLRAPFLPQLARSDLLVVIGDGGPGARLAAMARDHGRPVVAGRFAVVDAARFAGRDLLAFCGIGRPEKFAETLAAAGARNVILRPFPDHHVYGEDDARRLLDESERTGLPLVTTEKDRVKLIGGPWRDRLACAADVARIALALDDEAPFDALAARFSR